MARITIEDCLKQIPNRFQLTLCATYRARHLLNSGSSTLPSSASSPMFKMIALNALLSIWLGFEASRLTSELPSACLHFARNPLPADDDVATHVITLYGGTHGRA